MPRLSAFPTTPDPEGFLEVQPGMELRDWFAGQAMQALITRATDDDIRQANFIADTVDDAYRFADAVVETR